MKIDDSPHLRDAGTRSLHRTWIALGSAPDRSLAMIGPTRQEGEVLDYVDRLRWLAVNDGEGRSASAGVESIELDPKTLALVRLAALIAVRGAVPSYGSATDAAVDAGATTAEIVDVLAAVVPIVGLPCVVAAAPKVSLALGYDIDEALEQQPNG